MTHRHDSEGVYGVCDACESQASGAAITRGAFAQGMGLLGERYGRELTPALSRVYLDAFLAVDMSGAEFVAGVKLAITDCTFFPSPREIIERARPVLDPIVEAGLVFTDILSDREVRKHDGAREVWSIAAVRDRYSDAAARAVLAIGGVRRLATLTEDAAPFVVKEFARAYVAISTEVRARRLADRVIGAGAEQRRIASGGQRGKLERLGAVTPRALLNPGEATP